MSKANFPGGEESDLELWNKISRPHAPQVIESNAVQYVRQQ